MNEYKSFYKIVDGSEGARCMYNMRLDTYGRGCQHDCSYCYAKGLLALVGLGIEEVQCLVCDGLTDEQKKKYRYLDNKTGEKAVWDLVKLENEMEGLDLEGFDFFGMEDQEEKDGARDMVGATEIDMEEYADETFKYQCPKCGFRFN